MRKIMLFTVVFLMTGLGSLIAQDSGSTFKVTPPPVPCLKFFPGVSQFSVTGIHYTMGELEGQAGMTGSPVAYGFDANYAFSSKKKFLGAQNGGIINFSYMNISIPMNLMNEEENTMRTNSYNLGFYGVIDLVNGEKRDIAGEIIALKPTVAIFVGGLINYYSLNMGPLYQMLGYQEDIKARTLTTNYSVGTASDLPLGYFFALVPYLRYTFSMSSIQMKVPEPFNPTELYTETYISDYDFMDYGLDINLRPFRNAPDWLISLGMAISQIEGLSKGNRLITLSIKHEIGKFYSSTTIGPALH
jgi:hypothetical protein